MTGFSLSTSNEILINIQFTSDSDENWELNIDKFPRWYLLGIVQCLLCSSTWYNVSNPNPTITMITRTHSAVS